MDPPLALRERATVLALLVLLLRITATTRHHSRALLLALRLRDRGQKREILLGDQRLHLVFADAFDQRLQDGFDLRSSE